VLTRNGWILAVVAVILGVAGRAFGMLELFIVAATVAVLLAVSVVIVLVRRPELAVVRTAIPARVTAGTPCRVELTIANRAPDPSPVVRLIDPVSGTLGADLRLAPMTPGQTVRGAYRLPTERRGVLRLGPMTSVCGDPFGLASATRQVTGAMELVVYPRVDQLAPPPLTSGSDPLGGVRRRTSLASTGDEFSTLRGYVPGDELRRVHWPSSARHDELVVRQDEQAWQGRLTVVLDDRRASHGGDSLELAVSAAASLLVAGRKRRDLTRFVTVGGTDSGFGSGHGHVEAVMDHLAVLRTANGGELAATLEALAKVADSGLIVTIVAGLSTEELAGLEARRNRARGHVLVVSFAAAPPPAVPTAAAKQAKRRASRSDDGWLVVSTEAPFADQWNRRFDPSRRSA
jgi:uncharacterized protein (DUF58 family)